jgi:hypothetical protein
MCLRFLFLVQMSNERNKLLKQHHKLASVDTTLNIKGKKLQLYREIRKGLGEERSALRALRKELDYDSEDSEAIETKQSIAEYKRAAEEALDGLKNARVVEARGPSSPTESTTTTSTTSEKEKDGSLSGYGSPYEDLDSNRLV